MSVLDIVREHPGYIVGGVAVFVVILFLFNRGGGATSTGALDTTNSVDAATSLQTAQLGAAAQANQIDAALKAHTGDTAAQVDVAKMNFDYMTTHDTLAAGVANSALTTQEHISSLEAGVQTSAQQAQVQNTQAIIAGQTAQQGILANALMFNAATQSNTLKAAVSCTGLKSFFGAC